MFFKLKYFLTTFALVFLSAVVLNAEAKLTMLLGEVTNFELPRFDEDTGKKQWELFGKKAKFLGEEKIDVFDMALHLFDKSTSEKRAEILSAQAHVNTTTKIVNSDSCLIVKGDEFDLSGKKWQWNSDKSIVDIYSDVVVNFTPSKERRAKSADKKDSLVLQKTKITGNTARLENSSKENKFYVVGNAKVRSENLSVDCNTLTAITGDAQGKTSEGDISLIDAKGNVVLVRDNRRAIANHAVIHPREDEAVLSGNPEIFDISSKAQLVGYEIEFVKKTSSVRATSSKDKRASAMFFHSVKDGKTQKIEIYADEIVMTNEKSDNKVLFTGNVEVFGEDFSAKCKKIQVYANNVESKKPEVRLIKCLGGVSLKRTKEGSTANSWVMDIFPIENKTQLRGNVKLVNAKDNTTLHAENLTLYQQTGKEKIEVSGKVKLENTKDGSTLEADTLTLFQKQNRGNASSERGNFVKLTIPEDTASAVAVVQGVPVKNKQKSTKKASKDEAVVKSRSIDFIRNENSAKFTFNKDVSINSKSARATCQQMIVYSTASNKVQTSKIIKIEAFDNVRVVQNEYTAMAEVAVIYPKIDNKSSEKSAKKTPHKFVELLISEKKPNARPTILLPPMKNMGFDDYSMSYRSKKRPKMTKIISDRQWLTSHENTEKYYFEGNVVMTSTDAKGTCDKIEVLISPPNRIKRREIAEITFKGNVQLQQDQKEITCGEAKIYTKDEVAVLSKNPIVFNREDNTRAAGAKIIYNRGTKIISVEGDTQEAVDEFSDVENARPTIVLPQFNIKNNK